MSDRPISATGRESFRLIDLLRWGSACLVAIGHVRNLFFSDYTSLAHPSLLLKAFYALTGLGHEAVIVFFVISGYLVGGGLAVHGANRVSLTDYFIHRFSRIYVVLVPALAVTAFFDYLGTMVQPTLYLEAGWASALDFSAAKNDEPLVFACNLVNLQDAFCPSFGSNGPLWSLAYEWFYYLTFPAVLGLATGLQQKQSASRSIAIGVLVILAIAWLFPKYTAYYPIWLMGVAARLVSLRRPLSRYWAYGALAALPVLLAISRPHIYPALITDFLIGVALATLLCNPRITSGPRFLSGCSATMAGFSYSLYVVHFPLLVLMVALLTSTGVMVARLEPGAAALGLLVACLALAYAFAWAFSLVTERQTARLRRLLSEGGVPCGASLAGLFAAFRGRLSREAAQRSRPGEGDQPR